MKLSLSEPTVPLREFVRAFEQREAEVDGVIVFPLAARPEQFLEIYLQGNYYVRFPASGEEGVVPSAVVIGPSTHRLADLLLRHRLEVFTIQFQPSGFHRLFRVPMSELTNRAIEARSILGALFTELHDRLMEAPDFGKRVEVATDFLLRRAATSPSLDAVARVATRVLASSGVLDIGAAAAAAGLSVRQFERRFLAMVGITPRRYARIVRFQAALQTKLGQPERRWTDIAYDIGYHDQMHMVHDFRDFTGESPKGWQARLSANCETWA